MKKNLILGMVLVCGFQMAFAAGRSADTVRKGIEEAARTKIGETRATDQATRISNMSKTLSQISGSARDNEFRAALSRTLTVKEAEGSKSVSLAEIGSMLVSADQAVRTQLGGLDAAGKAHLDATQEAIKVASEFLSLASRTSEQGVMTEQQKLEVAAFNKQVSLIPEMLTKMDTADLKAHTEVMKKAIAKKTGPSVNGDQAFAQALKEGKSQEDYLQKLNELTACVR